MKMKFEECLSCWHCKASGKRKGYCLNRRIEVNYYDCCEKYKEASEKRKNENRKVIAEK